MIALRILGWGAAAVVIAAVAVLWVVSRLMALIALVLMLLAALFVATLLV